jgi:hypothetical protein
MGTILVKSFNWLRRGEVIYKLQRVVELYRVYELPNKARSPWHTWPRVDFKIREKTYYRRQYFRLDKTVSQQRCTDRLNVWKEWARWPTRWRNGAGNLATVLKKLNSVLREFVNHFKIASISSILQQLFTWIGRRLRAVKLRLWKKPMRLHRRLKQLKFKPNFKFIKMNLWRSAKSPWANYVMPNK